ncbi:MAG: SIS domain-containing protein [Anaerolineae bacterium]|nr:SIS domain-containing protein [Anaerolineae bacterium]
MIPLFKELAEQPQALRELANHYRREPGLLDLPTAQVGCPWVFTGMGASYHAAWIGALAFGSFGLPVQAIETVDLIHYSRLPEVGGWIVYVSQSGSSGEVNPFFQHLPAGNKLAALTNTLDSDLAKQARWVLPMCAGEETLIASKTFVNSLGVLWMLARKVAGVWNNQETGQLEQVADHAEQILAASAAIRERFLAFYDPASPLLFLGHGPHAATARQAAMGMSEWAKIPALYAGMGAFRHGFIESVRPGLRVVMISPPGKTRASALTLARELSDYGARVLLIENGQLHDVDEEPFEGPLMDEFLSPLLDILPIQIAMDGLAVAAGIEPGFRFISKVVRQL